MKKPLRVMKFGGTSVGDASCIGRVAKILKGAAAEGPIVCVVSAMSGVTNRLIDAANLSALAEGKQVDVIFASLRLQHESALASLIHDDARRKRVAVCLAKIFDEGERLCRGPALLHQLPPRPVDALSSLGERLSAPMVAGALSELGTPSESVEATELIVTDSSHGGADPRMDKTRERSEARLRPLLAESIVPVVTGFIGATQDGVLTTLGRGGSDYSATILGAALGAGEVIIWTDVDGVMTADPRLVPEARTIPEISFPGAAGASRR